MDETGLGAVFRQAWGRDTCDPHDLAEWTAGNPARGQCGVTALITQELLGGDLVLGEVFVDGAKVGHHYWNRLPGGREIDFTADQFRPDEVVTGGQIQERPPGPPRRCREQYEILRARVSGRISPGCQEGSRPGVRKDLARVSGMVAQGGRRRDAEAGTIGPGEAPQVGEPPAVGDLADTVRPGIAAGQLGVHAVEA
jgi:hypothetical protein